MEYKGFFKAVNPKPTGEYIEIFVSDWNKEHFAFYSYIDKDNYEDDITEINKLIKKLNFRDGDIYIELIDCSTGLDGFYKYLYELGYYTQSDVLNKEYWEILEDKGDEHFSLYSHLRGGSDIDELKDFEYSVFNSWEEALEIYNPELYKALDEANGLYCFDIQHFYNCSGLYEIDDLIVADYY